MQSATEMKLICQKAVEDYKARKAAKAVPAVALESDGHQRSYGMEVSADGMFRCRAGRCTMARSACMRRRAVATGKGFREGGWMDVVPCAKCEQWPVVAAELVVALTRDAELLGRLL